MRLPVTALAAALCAAALNAEPPHVVKDVDVYREPGRVGGWPANSGIWNWGDEILVGFSQGYFKHNDRGHSIDRQKPDVLRFARSRDGGLTWTIERPNYLDENDHERDGTACPGGLDFTAPDSAIQFRMVSSAVGGYSRFYYTNDRGHFWQGPYKLPHYDHKGIAARTDYLVDGPHEVTAFITASKENGNEGRPLCIRTTDGGKTWPLVAEIGPEPTGFAIMNASVRLSPTRILTTVRRMEPIPREQRTGGVMEGRHFIDAWVSDDNGSSWTYLNRPVESTGGANGSAQSLTRLRDGRLAITYGYRSPPYTIRARISTDQGMTWGPEIMLREGAGSWDLGYTRTVQRTDGKIVTVYYYNDPKDTERFLAATIWDAGT